MGCCWPNQNNRKGQDLELQPGQLGKGGIVKDPMLLQQVQQRVTLAAQAVDVQVLSWLNSTIEGGDGNREFFIHARCPE